MLLHLLLASPLVASASVGTAVQPAHERISPVVDPIFVSYGDVTGSWLSATLIEDGVVSGVLRDAIGQPLWLLDAKLHAGGKVSGDLLPLQFGANPVLAMGDLAVLGNAQLAAQGGGSFALMIYDPHVDAYPPIPLGYVEGDLQDGRVGGSSTQVQSAGAYASGQFAPARAGSGPSLGQGSVKPYQVRELRDPSQGSSIQGLSGYGEPQGGAQAGNVIQCPKGPSFSVSGVSSAEKSASGAGSHGQPQGGAQAGGVIACPEDPAFALGAVSSAGQHGASGMQKSGSGQAKATSMGGYSNAGHAQPPSGSGKLIGSWYLLF